MAGKCPPLSRRFSGSDAREFSFATCEFRCSRPLVPLFRILELLDFSVKPRYNASMRPLYHPRPEETTVQGILYALSDPVRVRIFIKLMSADCAKCCSEFANVSNKPLPKSTLSQHFKILREAGLIWSERKGVELQSHVRCAELKKKFGRMINAILKAYQGEAAGVGS